MTIIDCNKARAGLWPPERPRLVGDEVAAARSHVRECEACQAYCNQDRALLDLYDRARTSAAPIKTRERVFDALAGERWDTTIGRESAANADAGHAASDPSPGGPRLSWITGGAFRRFGAWPAAVAALLVIVFAIESRPAGQLASDSPDMFVEDYLRRAVGQDHIETSDPAEVTRFLERELGLSIGPIMLAGLDIARAEICLLEGRRGAMIVYKRNGAEVSHYLVPRDDATRRAPALSRSRGSSAADMPVVTWATPRIEQALVGEVASEQLLEIAAFGSSDD